METRPKVAVLIVVIAVVAAVAYATMPFQVDRSVTAYELSAFVAGGDPRSFVVDARLACPTFGADHYLDDRGAPMVFDGSSPTYSGASNECRMARDERCPVSAAIVLVALLAAAAVLLTDRTRGRRAEGSGIDRLEAAELPAAVD